MNTFSIVPQCKSLLRRNNKRFYEMFGIKHEILAEQIGMSQATFSGYEKKDKLEQDILDKLAKVLDIPVEAITELNNGASINIVSSTLHDNAGSVFNYSTFNPIDKIVELYDKLLQSEKEKVAMLQEVLRDKK